MKKPSLQEVLVHEARHVTRLADALLVAASECAEERSLSPGAVLGAFTVALGRLTGSTARVNQESVTLLGERVVDQVRRVARLEFGRRPWTLQ